MEDEPGRSLILWTVRVSVALYAVSVWRYLSRRRSDSSVDRVYQCLWTASWLMCTIHVVCAFHFQHHWNHQAALDHTAKMTQRVVGWYWAGGLYINYLFLIWWGTDVVRLARQSTSMSAASMHAIAAFMMFNATVVFGPRWWIIPTSIFGIAVIYQLRRRSTDSQKSNANVS